MGELSSQAAQLTLADRRLHKEISVVVTLFVIRMARQRRLRWPGNLEPGGRGWPDAGADHLRRGRKEDAVLRQRISVVGDHLHRRCPTVCLAY